MPRSPLANKVQNMASVASEAARRNVNTEQVIAERAARSTSRRDFLKLAAATLAAVAFQPQSPAHLQPLHALLLWARCWEDSLPLIA